jgi:hypothetical protein
MTDRPKPHVLSSAGPAHHQHRCIHCFRPFNCTRADRAYCSSKCRQAAHRKRARADLAARYQPDRWQQPELPFDDLAFG